jgi:L-serine/L-threonine ammonia-lyase
LNLVLILRRLARLAIRWYHRSMALHVRTQLLQSSVLSALTNKRVYLKLEALQPSGSFKARGIGAVCEDLKRRGVARFVSSSGGNAGIAVAYAGKELGVPVTVVVPETTSERAKGIIASFGAEVIVHGASWQEAHEQAESLARSSGSIVHPFDHPLLWSGNSTLVDEIVDEGIRPDVVIVSVGGGGLYSGVVEGLRRNGLTSVPVIAVETEGMASFHTSIKRGELIELDAVTGVATSLGAKRVAEQAFALQQVHPTRSVLVSDKQAVSACVRFLDDHRLLVEPACGAALAAVYDNAPELAGYQTIVCVVCGGCTLSADQLKTYAQAMM